MQVIGGIPGGRVLVADGVLTMNAEGNEEKRNKEIKGFGGRHLFWLKIERINVSEMLMTPVLPIEYYYTLNLGFFRYGTQSQ